MREDERINSEGLREQRTIVRYQSQQDALKFMRDVVHDDRGIVTVCGPTRSGKSVVAKQFMRAVRADLAVAIVDGGRTKTSDFLTDVLNEFGFTVKLESVEEMMNTLVLFIVQQAQTNQPPILIVENVNDMFPTALSALCKLASIAAEGRPALRFVLVGDQDIRRVIDSPSMAEIANRVIGGFDLGPMNSKESVRYLYAKLRSSGVDRPDDIFSVDVCEKLHELSGGWPGELEELAYSLIEFADEYPIRIDGIVEAGRSPLESSPKLIITIDGESPKEVLLTEKRALIGRADLSDIVICDQFVSSQHAMLIQSGNAVVLVDLKSRNGTFVNARRVQSKVLLHDDIIGLGDHRLKMVYADPGSARVTNELDLRETSKLQNIDDARQRRDKGVPNLVVLPRKKI